jgi:hypothetical protein
MPEYRRLEVRDCQGVLWAFYRKYEGQSVASFEGDLSGLRLEELRGASPQESDPLRRQTLEPELDFITVPINAETVDELKKRLTSPGILGRDGSVIHTQLAAGNDLLLIACDNFHDDCTVASLSVPEQFLKEMLKHGLLRTYGDA